MNEQKKWHVLNQPHSHQYIKNSDTCLYRREYISGKGYQGGPTNSMILNFKKPPSRKKNSSEWEHRQTDIEQFKNEIEALFKKNLKITVTAIPSSKHKTHPEYDNRFEDLFKELLKSRPFLNVEWPIEIRKTNPASHRGGKRSPESIKKNYIWKGFENNIRIGPLCIFDDILTTGAHFRSVSDFLMENGYTGEIIGIFWSRAIKQSIF